MPAVLSDIHTKALKQFDAIMLNVQAERKLCLNDRRFYSIEGAQWEKLQDQFANRPKFEINKTHLSVIRIFNEYRNNRITVDFTDKFGSKDTGLASVLDGLYRADEIDSDAEAAYDNAFEEAAGGGFGAFRLMNKYVDEEDEENEEQRIFFEPIFDADTTVFFDINSKKQDKSDAKHAFILTPMSIEAYKELYKDDPASWKKGDFGCNYDWVVDNSVIIAEYFMIEKKDKEIKYYEDNLGDESAYTEEDFNLDPELSRKLEATGATLIRTRTIKRRVVHKYILSGFKILKDAGLIAGKHIPIVPIFGKRWVVQGIERCMGQVRLQKDAQVIKNIQMSKLAEIGAMSSTEKPIVTQEQIEGHEQMWKEDNIINYPYLVLNAMVDKDGVLQSITQISYTKPPSVPPVIAALTQVIDQDLKELQGNPEQGEQIKTHVSGKAVELVQNQIGLQPYIYISNFGKGMKRSGVIWLSMAREILVENKRALKVIDKSGSASKIEINVKTVDANNVTVIKNDITKAKHNVSVNIGPSSDSKRAAAVKALTGMMQITADPEAQKVLTNMAMMNMEGEGVEDAREFFRWELIKMGAIPPTEEEQKKLEQEMANAKPDPNEVYLTEAAANEKAKAGKTQADTALSGAKTEKTKAETAEIIHNIPQPSKDED